MEEKFYYAIGFRWPDSGTLDFYTLWNSEILYGDMEEAKKLIEDLKITRPNKNYFIVKLSLEVLDNGS